MSMNRDLAYLAQRLLAMACLLVGRSGRAEAVFTRMLEAWPDDAYALASRSHLRAQAGRIDEALDDARTLVARHPARSAADWFNLGYLLESRGDTTEAADAFRHAVDMDPKLDRAWYGLGLALIREQRFAEAVEALKQNTTLQPMSPYGWYQLARTHANLMQPEEARRIIRHLHGFEPKVAAQLERETGLTP